MKKDAFKWISGIVLAVLMHSAGAAAKKPNVVIFLIDDMGWKNLGCFGAELYETPNIDRLCSEGIRFSQAYTSAAICAPARASLLSGMHPMRFGMWNHLHFITPGTKVLPEFLKENGYQTWHVGKWHMGNPEQKTLPLDMGFEKSAGGSIAFGPGSYFWPFGCDPDTGMPRKARMAVPEMCKIGKKGDQLTELLTDQIETMFKDRDPDRPFYLNFWPYSVHSGQETSPELKQKYERKIEAMGLTPTYRIDEKTGAKLLTSETNPVFAGMVETLDVQIGRVIEMIKAAGEYDNTLFIFYSDNGCTTQNVPCAPLNGGKNSTYEAGIRVPAFIAWKGHVQPASEYSKPVYICDVFDTVLDAAGIDQPDREDDGISLMPVLNGQSLPPRQFVWYFPDERAWWAQRPNAAIFDERSGMKYISFFNGDPDEMYDLRNDFAEAHNVASEYPELGADLKKNTRAFLNRYYKTTKAPPKRYADGVEAFLLAD
jgi:arylsulfatase A-like enzyme